MCSLRGATSPVIRSRQTAIMMACSRCGACAGAAWRRRTTEDERVSDRTRIDISIAEQRLRYWEDGALVMDVAVATAKKGAGEQRGSECTPRVGRHQDARLLRVRPA